MSALQLIAWYRIKDESVGDVLALLPGFITSTRAEPGNLASHLYLSVEDDRECVLLERYVDRGALDAHRRTAHFTETLLKQIAPRLDSRVIETYDAEDGQ